MGKRIVTEEITTRGTAERSAFEAASAEGTRTLKLGRERIEAEARERRAEWTCPERWARVWERA